MRPSAASGAISYYQTARLCDRAQRVEQSHIIKPRVFATERSEWSNTILTNNFLFATERSEWSKLIFFPAVWCELFSARLFLGVPLTLRTTLLFLSLSLVAISRIIEPDAGPNRCTCCRACCRHGSTHGSASRCCPSYRHDSRGQRLMTAPED